MCLRTRPAVVRPDAFPPVHFGRGAGATPAPVPATRWLDQLRHELFGLLRDFPGAAGPRWVAIAALLQVVRLREATWYFEAARDARQAGDDGQARRHLQALLRSLTGRQERHGSAAAVR